jgi:hypothetical protein
MFDTFFISFNETNQEKNWKTVLEFHPNAIRLHGIKGIDKVHLICNDICSTERFWTIDGDNVLFSKLEWEVTESLENIDLFLFDAMDPIQQTFTNLGGVKLWKKNSIINNNMSKGDFCLNATNTKCVIHHALSITEYNTSPYDTWKTAFRHCVKLKSKIFENREFATNIKQYLTQWENCKNLDNGTNNAKWAYRGFHDAGKYVDKMNNFNSLLKINDYNWLREYFKEKYREA